jgi:hypothetical protein
MIVRWAQPGCACEEETDYQNGMDWMRRLKEEWPVKKTINPPPAEECRKDMALAIPRTALTMEVAMVQAAETAQDWLPYPPESAPQVGTRYFFHGLLPLVCYL